MSEYLFNLSGGMDIYTPGAIHPITIERWKRQVVLPFVPAESMHLEFSGVGGLRGKFEVWLISFHYESRQFHVELRSKQAYSKEQLKAMGFEKED